MHVSEDHAEMLPDGFQPMLMPDTTWEAIFLLRLLENGFYPDEDTLDVNSPTDPGRHDSSLGARIPLAHDVRL